MPVNGANYFICVLLLSSLFSSSVCQNLTPDTKVLLSLRDSISNWQQFATGNNVVGWNTSISTCAWTGVSCIDNGRVSRVTLACEGCRVKAVGVLPASLGTLSFLSALDLDSNELHGSLPPEWCAPNQFPMLQSLFLYGNAISGAIPWRGSCFPQLQLLRLDGNDLQGGFPEDLVLPELKILRAFDNPLGGKLPPELLDNMPNLRIAALQNTSLTGQIPSEWNSSVVEEIYLQNNQLTGGLPNVRGQPTAFPSLSRFDLSGNPLGGTLRPQWAGNLPSLQSLELARTSLNGELPASWAGAFPAIEFIDISGNKISGAVDVWAPFSMLKRLVIRPGNPELCVYDADEIPFRLCDLADASCLMELQGLPNCPGTPAAEVAAGAGSGSIQAPPSADQDDFPVVAVAVPVAIVASLAIAAACFIVARRLGRKKEEPKDAEAQVHPFDSLEAQAALTSPFAPPTSFINVNSAALAATSTETSAAPSPISRSKSAASMGESKSKFCGRLMSKLTAMVRRRSSSQPSGTSTPALTTPRTPSKLARSGNIEMQMQSGVSSGASSLQLQRRGEGGGLSAMSSLETPFAAVRGGFRSSLESQRTTDGGVRSSVESQRTPGGNSLLSPMSRQTSGGWLAPSEWSPEIGAELPISDWKIDPGEIEVLQRPDGSDWLLGAGATGKVYKGLRIVQPVAVKKMEVGGDRGVTIEEFEKEVSILRACRDANLVQFQGAYMDPEFMVLVTEYMEGGNLMSNIAAGRVSWWRRGRKIAIDIAKGLAFLHARNIVHFDLKSPNILLARDGTAKISDVGMARFVRSQDYVTGVVATLAWSAPEMLWGSQNTAKADIYSLGIVLWEICSGEAPVRGQLRDLRVPEECPAEVRDLILECLDTRPGRRPTAVQIVGRLQATAKEPLPRLSRSSAASGDTHAAARLAAQRPAGGSGVSAAVAASEVPQGQQSNFIKEKT